MALIACPECSKEISDQASACPHCGNPLAVVPEPPPAVESAASPGSFLVILGGVAVAVGAFLPWITANTVFATVSRNGLDGGGDGIIALGGGVLLAALGLARKAGIGTFVLAVGMGVVAFLNLQDITDRLVVVQSDYAVGSVGAGIWAIFVGAALAAVGSSFPRSKAQADSGR